MKITLSKYKFILPLYGLFFIGLFVISVIPVSYSSITPAYNDNIADTIYVYSEYETEGSFHTTSVIALDTITLYQRLLGFIVPKSTVYEQPDYLDNVNQSDIFIMDRLTKDDSIQTSIVVGFSKLNQEVEFTSYYTVFLTYNHLTSNSLKVGDSILSVNGNSDIVSELQDIPCLAEATFLIIRNGEELSVTAKKNEVEDTCSFGLYIKPLTEIISINRPFRIYPTNTGGPSGGLMQSLYVYNQLVEEDLTHGLKIGGTGTIDVDGNVGYIGGVREKIATAIANDIDIFFVPYLENSEDDNYIKALAAKEEFNSDIIIVGVSTFEEALAYFESLGDNNDN